jgi:hypothetical protein
VAYSIRVQNHRAKLLKMLGNQTLATGDAADQADDDHELNRFRRPNNFTGSVALAANVSWQTPRTFSAVRKKSLCQKPSYPFQLSTASQAPFQVSGRQFSIISA